MAEAIQWKNDLLNEKFHDRVRLVGAFDSTSYEISKEGLPPAKLLAQKLADGKVGASNMDMDPISIVQDLEYDTLIDVTPTNILNAEPSLTYIRTALKAGRNVITSNKGPLAMKFREISDLAEANGVHLRYEASVGGAMPIINLSRELLPGESDLFPAWNIERDLQFHP